MGKVTSHQIPEAVVGETNLDSVSFVNVLDDGESLTGTPTVTEVTTTDLTIANVSINTAALVINGQSVPIGRAVQFKVSGQLTANSPYKLKITATTDSSPAQTKIRFVTFTVLQ